MIASQYWSMLTGYWTLFKDRAVFTALWDAMIKACEEYAALHEHVNDGGILSAGESFPLVWERINITFNDPDYIVTIIDNDGVDKGYDIVSISTIRTDVGETAYISGTDFTFDSISKEITWINPPDPADGVFIADEVYINTGIIDAFYNSGLYNLDLTQYTAPGAKWVLYACIKHLGFFQTPERMKNIISILAGAPFSKYYGEFSADGANCHINYAVDISTEHELFLSKNELEGYCYLDEETGEIYDGRYPDEGTPLVLCHKNNLLKTDETYSIILRGESYPYTGQPEYTSGELFPIYLLGDITEGSVALQHSDISIPLYAISSLGDNEISASYDYSSLPGLIQPLMEIEYTDNLTIEDTEIEVTGASEIKVDDPMVYRFVAGEDIILTEKDGPSAYCNIISGYYSEAEETYLITVSAALDVDKLYSMTVPITRRCICPVTEIEPGSLVVSYDVTSAQIPVLRQCPAGASYGRTLYISSGTSGGIEITIDTGQNLNTTSVGDTIIATSSGEQDYYTVTDIANWPTITITPKLRRTYVSGDLIYNIGKSLDIGRVRISGDDIEPEYMSNIETYLDIWLPGIMPHYGYTQGSCPAPTISIEYTGAEAEMTLIPAGEDDVMYYSQDGDDPVGDNVTLYEDKNLDNLILRDPKYWQRLSANAKKEIKD